jgi:hypothetical protein
MKKPARRVQHVTDWHAVHRAECGHGVLWLPEGLTAAHIAAHCTVAHGRFDNRRLAKLFGIPLSWLRGIDITVDSLATLTFADMLRWIPTDDFDDVERRYRDYYSMLEADSPDNQNAHTATFAWVVRQYETSRRSERGSEAAKRTPVDKREYIAQLLGENVPDYKIKAIAHVGQSTIDDVKKALRNPK